MHKNIRKHLFAGSFYPADAKELTNDIAHYLENDGQKKTYKSIRALILPHAGYIYSGEIAGSGYRLLKEQPRPKNIFLIGSSHRHLFDGAAIMNEPAIQTPLGIVNIENTVSAMLMRKYPVFKANNAAHDNEHSLEVHLPFLQHLYGNSLNIIPVLIGTDKKSDCKRIADALKPFFNSENLFIISTDFSHYPSYEEALKIDNETADWVIQGNPEAFYRNIKAGDDQQRTGVLTRMCGWTATLTLMYLAQANPELNYSIIRYANSGDIEFGDRNRVVGYFSFMLTE